MHFGFEDDLARDSRVTKDLAGKLKFLLAFRLCQHLHRYYGQGKLARQKERQNGIRRE